MHPSQLEFNKMSVLKKKQERLSRCKSSHVFYVCTVLYMEQTQKRCGGKKRRREKEIREKYSEYCTAAYSIFKCILK